MMNYDKLKQKIHRNKSKKWDTKQMKKTSEETVDAGVFAFSNSELSNRFENFQDEHHKTKKQKSKRILVVNEVICDNPEQATSEVNEVKRKHKSLKNAWSVESMDGLSDDNFSKPLNSHISPKKSKKSNKFIDISTRLPFLHNENQELSKNPTHETKNKDNLDGFKTSSNTKDNRLLTNTTTNYDHGMQENLQRLDKKAKKRKKSLDYLSTRINEIGSNRELNEDVGYASDKPSEVNEIMKSPKINKEKLLTKGEEKSSKGIVQNALIVNSPNRNLTKSEEEIKIDNQSVINQSPKKRRKKKRNSASQSETESSCNENDVSIDVTKATTKFNNSQISTNYQNIERNLIKSPKKHKAKNKSLNDNCNEIHLIQLSETEKQNDRDLEKSSKRNKLNKNNDVPSENNNEIQDFNFTTSPKNKVMNNQSNLFCNELEIYEAVAQFNSDEEHFIPLCDVKTGVDIENIKSPKTSPKKKKFERNKNSASSETLDISSIDSSNRLRNAESNHSNNVVEIYETVAEFNPEIYLPFDEVKTEYDSDIENLKYSSPIHIYSSEQLYSDNIYSSVKEENENTPSGLEVDKEVGDRAQYTSSTKSRNQHKDKLDNNKILSPSNQDVNLLKSPKKLKETKTKLFDHGGENENQLSESTVDVQDVLIASEILGKNKSNAVGKKSKSRSASPSKEHKLKLNSNEKLDTEKSPRKLGKNKTKLFDDSLENANVFPESTAAEENVVVASDVLINNNNVEDDKSECLSPTSHRHKSKLDSNKKNSTSQNLGSTLEKSTGKLKKNKAKVFNDNLENENILPESIVEKEIFSVASEQEKKTKNKNKSKSHSDKKNLSNQNLDLSFGKSPKKLGENKSTVREENISVTSELQTSNAEDDNPYFCNTSTPEQYKSKWDSNDNSIGISLRKLRKASIRLFNDSLDDDNVLYELSVEGKNDPVAFELQRKQKNNADYVKSIISSPSSKERHKSKRNSNQQLEIRFGKAPKKENHHPPSSDPKTNADCENMKYDGIKKVSKHKSKNDEHFENLKSAIEQQNEEILPQIHLIRYDISELLESSNKEKENLSDNKEADERDSRVSKKSPRKRKRSINKSCEMESLDSSQEEESSKKRRKIKHADENNEEQGFENNKQSKTSFSEWQNDENSSLLNDNTDNINADDENLKESTHKHSKIKKTVSSNYTPRKDDLVNDNENDIESRSTVKKVDETLKEVDKSKPKSPVNKSTKKSKFRVKNFMVNDKENNEDNEENVKVDKPKVKKSKRNRQSNDNQIEDKIVNETEKEIEKQSNIKKYSDENLNIRSEQEDDEEIVKDIGKPKVKKSKRNRQSNVNKLQGRNNILDELKMGSDRENEVKSSSKTKKRKRSSIINYDSEDPFGTLDLLKSDEIVNENEKEIEKQSNIKKDCNENLNTRSEQEYNEETEKDIGKPKVKKSKRNRKSNDNQIKDEIVNENEKEIEKQSKIKKDCDENLNMRSEQEDDEEIVKDIGKPKVKKSKRIRQSNVDKIQDEIENDSEKEIEKQSKKQKSSKKNKLNKNISLDNKENIINNAVNVKEKSNRECNNAQLKDESKMESDSENEVKSSSKTKKRKRSSIIKYDSADSFETLDLKINANEYKSNYAYLLGNLNINLDFQVPKLHRMGNLTRSPPEETIKENELVVKTGTFSTEESKIIQENWKKFYQEYDLPDDPKMFTSWIHPDISLKPILNNKERKKFVQYLGHGLPERTLKSIHFHFQYLFANVKKGRFTAKEDEIILEHMSKLKVKTNCYSDIGKKLNRDRLAIEKRYEALQRIRSNERKNLPVNIEKTDVEYKVKFIKCLMKATDSKRVIDLKGLHVSAEAWRVVIDKLQIQRMQAYSFWYRTLHQQLFAHEELNTTDLKIKLVDLLLENEEFDWKVINFSNLMQHFDGITSTYLSKVMQNMRSQFLKNSKLDMKESLLYLQEYLRTTPIKSCKIKSIHFTDRTLRIENETYELD